MSSYNKLLNNSAVFAIGNLGSKLITLLLVPLYTYYLSTAEYGIVDIVSITVLLLVPLISLNIYDAVLRFSMEKSQRKDAVLTNALLLSFMLFFILIFFYPILNKISLLNELLEYTLLITFLQIIQVIFGEFTRALGKIKTYALNGILVTAIIGISNILYLVHFKMGIDGYFLSIITANIVSIVFLSVYGDILRFINFKRIEKELILKMLLYSVPLMPNALMWWSMNASNRYLILYFAGTSAAGLFAVASKIPSLLSILNSFFFQAWQLSAIEEFDSKNKSEFYSKVFQYFSVIMLIGTSFILMITKPLMSHFLSSDFYISWEFVPLLLLGTMFSSYSGFLGTNYIAAKQTKGVFKTSFIGGVISLILNFLLIPTIGVNGAGISTAISFLVIWILRIQDTKKFVSLDINYKSMFKNIFIICLQAFTLYLNLNQYQEFCASFFLFLVLIYSNRDLMNIIKTNIYKIIMKNK